MEMYAKKKLKIKNRGRKAGMQDYYYYYKNQEQRTSRGSSRDSRSGSGRQPGGQG
jgi:hypothetical protein